MSYILQWKNPALAGKSPITVNVATTVADASSLIFTGKGAANYGGVQQENLLRLLDNFADSAEPEHPTIGQLWYNSTAGVLNVCKSVLPVSWVPMQGIQVTDVGTAPVNPNVGDIWFERSPRGGFLYVYTGTGRFPSVAWSARASNAIPAVAPAAFPYLYLKPDFSAFSNANPNEAYICGYLAGIPADVDGQIKINGALTTVPKGVLSTRYKIDDGFIMWDRAISAFFAIRPTGLGTWEYDNNVTWVPFTPSALQYVIGLITTTGNDMSAGSPTPGIGIGSTEIWETALPLTSFSVTATSSSTDGIGGWHQIWPSTEYHGSRFEYDALLSLVYSFIGTSATWGGNGAARGLDLANLETADANLVTAAYGAGSGYLTTNGAIGSNFSAVKVEPVSQDWDRLLGAARWALQRLDVPLDTVISVSASPFTVDGRQAPDFMLQLPTSDIRYPTLERLSGRRFGAITSMHRYTETMNALQSASASRYTLAGIAGTNSTRLGFSPTVTTTSHATHGTTGLSGGSISLSMRFNFDTMQDINRFINGGSAIDIKFGYVPSAASTADIAMNAFMATYGRLRITANKVYTFGPGTPLSLVQAPVNSGLLNLVSGSNTSLATLTANGITLSVFGSLVAAAASSSYITLVCTFTTPAGLSGTTSVEHLVTRDAQVFGSNHTPYFPAPAAFALGADTAGSSAVWLNGTVTPAPVLSITSQPVSRSVTTGATASFSVSAQGTAPLSYRWQLSVDGGTTFNDITGAIASTYSLSATIADSSHKFRAIVTDSTGPVTSNVVTLTVLLAALTINQDVIGTSVLAGNVATFSVGATGPNTISYQWQVAPTLSSGAFTNISGATSSTYSLAVTQSDTGKAYRVIVSDTSGTSLASSTGLLLVATSGQTAVGFPVTWGTNNTNNGAGIPTNITTATWGMTAGVAMASQPQQSVPPSLAVNVGTKTRAGVETPAMISLPVLNVTITSGSLPPGVSLVRVDSAYAGGGGYYFSGTPAAAGTYTFTLLIASTGSWSDAYLLTVDCVINVY
jgi:hypothetical protein